MWQVQDVSHTNQRNAHPGPSSETLSLPGAVILNSVADPNYNNTDPDQVRPKVLHTRHNL